MTTAPIASTVDDLIDEINEDARVSDGPWSFNPVNRCVEGSIAGRRGSTPIAQIVAGSAADGHLISAARDLLTALQALLLARRHGAGPLVWIEVEKQAHLALAKARGTAGVSFNPCCRCGRLRFDDELNGADPVSGDYSKAYCRRLLDCQSAEAHKILSDVLRKAGDA